MVVGGCVPRSDASMSKKKALAEGYAVVAGTVGRRSFTVPPNVRSVFEICRLHRVDRFRNPQIATALDLSCSKSMPRRMTDSTEIQRCRALSKVLLDVYESRSRRRLRGGCTLPK